ncbi:unnamed protein product [marine sediment metagenome]|uniref:Glycosyl transferase family 1 domain-containing protein n=1 Tax=marine sediment metagenome TaxID=412755 RepID=X1GR11_9ZZZZ
MDGFHVLGYQPYSVIRDVFKKSSVFVCPARAKAFGLPVVEAMSAGLIPVTTHRTGARDFVMKVHPKLVVSINKLSKRVTEVLSMDSDERSELLTRGSEVALSWNEETAKKVHLKAIGELLAAKNDYPE